MQRLPSPSMYISMIKQRRQASAKGLLPVLLGLICLQLLSGCEEPTRTSYQPEFSAQSAQAGNIYIFGVHPQRNPRMLRAVFGPMVDYLDEHIPEATFVFEASRNFHSFDLKVDRRHFDFVLPNPYGTLRAIDHGYNVFGQMGNEGDLRGLILVRKDSTVQKVTDLRDRDVSFPGPTALAATIMPKYYLHTHGLDVKQEINPRYVGSMESSLLNIHMGAVTAGTAYPPAWRMFQQQQPEAAAELKVLWKTDPLPDNSLMARDDIPASLVKQVAETLFNMPHTQDGRQVLRHMDLRAFIPANNATYQPVQEFLSRYEKEIGSVEAP